MQAEARAEHRTHQPPRGIQQKYDQPPAREVGGVEFPLRKIPRAPARIKQDGIILRIVDQSLHGLVFVKADAEVKLAVAEAEVREPAGVRLHPFEFIGVHEKHKFRARRHRRDRATPAMAQRPITTVTHFSTHGSRKIVGRAGHDQREYSA